MAKRIHFEDNIFFINLLIRSIRDAGQLELDPELFMLKLMDDLRFVDRILNTLLAELLANSRLLERQEQLVNIAETEERYMAVLNTIVNGHGYWARDLGPLVEDIELIKQSSRKRCSTILAETAVAPNRDEDQAVVSSFELNELLRGDDLV